LIRKISGFLILGLIPVTFAAVFFEFNPQLYLGFSGSASFHWDLQAFVIILLLLINFINARNADLQSKYPEMRIKRWSEKSLLVAWLGWFIYLMGYEYLFRGVLLFSCIDAFGIGPAVVINLALYSALHLPKGFKEAIAAIPFGAFLCYITIESNSIIPAILIHAIQAISAEFSCIYRNKEMLLTNKLTS
jgi:membrane protease YdiL (CAAX protease family)